ncbi:hypothetical protein BU24DRAFT_227753 [Aaosphaeria arxii CBS 175.79]|uniref:Uncharacterized protein n=1 Tax=Aaosphaeria arxii CBS 175.79 TaxID=1450172 RepID=A0A6A5XQP8_9PLEO|nr:uncharacterized protein BU24DRAFT_227753 [Aaosphaeria arxii CBS 175.79]KAF2015060.1 hypothetical protein BU24DRAFT_227753 [Aaosphaeria arxii CBS 175.79]
MPTAQDTTQPFARPTFPGLQGSNNSGYQSFQSSTSSLASSTPASAPLPSPSTRQNQTQDFFTNASRQQNAQQHQQQPAVSPMDYSYQPNRQGAGQTAAETTNFLNQTGLLAEAAKRAQMAVVMRDIEGMEL